jgi:O-antigen ligase
MLFTAIAVAPFPFGSTDPSMIAVWCVFLGFALLLASARGVQLQQGFPLIACAILAAAYVVVVWLQVSAPPALGGAPDPAWRQAGALLGTDLNGSISVIRNEPVFALGLSLLVILSFALSYLVCLDEVYARRLLIVISWSGVFYAVLGLVLFLVDPTKVLWRDKLAYFGSLTGTFTNRNTAAVYFGSCACVSMLLFFREVRSLQANGKRQLKSIFFTSDRPARRKLLWAALPFAVLMLALLMTASRAGVVLSLLGLVFAFIVFWWRHLERRSMILSTITVILFVLVILQVVAGSVGARFNESGVGDAFRFEVYRSSLQMIADRPWLGHGLGTFIWAFPPYRDAGAIWGIVNRAHNTLLEIALEMGIPFAVIVVVAWAGAIAVLIHGVRVRRDGLFIPAAALAVAAIGLAHSMVDFSLQIPGYSIMAFGLFGAGIAQSSRAQRSKRSRLG